MSVPDKIHLQIRHFVQSHHLEASKLVVAVSGGPDSVCLVHALSVIRGDLGLSLRVGHLDHRLRGADSDADAEYVEALARRLEIPATIGRADVRALQKSRKLTLEEAAREARYAFLAQTAHDIGTNKVLTGHTQNDNVETILLHIIRGSGLRGLVGLKPLTNMIFGGRRVRIVRPLLDITRQETVAYCQEYELEPRTDVSNLDTSFLRNKIRLKIMPLLERYNTDFTGSLLRLSMAASDDLDYLDGQVESLLKDLTSIDGNVITLDKQRLVDVHPALCRHLLRACFKRLPGGLKDVEAVHIEDMLSIVCGQAGRSIDLPHGMVFVAGYDRCWLGREADLPSPFHSQDGEHDLIFPGVTEIPGWRIEASIVQTFEESDDGLTAYMDIDKVGQSLNVRTWKKGDRFQPLGMDCEKKLGEFMIDARIPRHWRKNIPVVVFALGIAWLVGYRLDERVKVASDTKKILKLEVKPA